MSQNALTFNDKQQIANTLENFKECDGKSIEKFNKIIKFYKEKHAEEEKTLESDSVAVLYEIVGTKQNTLFVFYELSCGEPTINVKKNFNKHVQKNKHAEAIKQCDYIVTASDIKYIMIKRNEFDKIMQEFNHQLHEEYKLDAQIYHARELDDGCTYLSSCAKDTGVILKFTDAFAVQALEKGRKMHSIDMLYIMFDKLKEAVKTNKRE